MSKVYDLSTECSQTFYLKSKESNTCKCKKKVSFNPSIGIFFIESYKEYNHIECKCKKDKIKRFNKSQRVGCSCEIF